VRAYRSPAKLFAFGVFGIILIVAAIDVLFGHWISTVPENTNGVLTTRGQAQQRGDIVWGAAMAGMGVLLVGGAVVELVRRRSMVAVTAEGLVLPVGAHEADVSIPWSDIEDVSSDIVLDPYDGSLREVLVISFIDAGAVPSDPIGATWSDGRLLVDAHDWTRTVTDVALSAQGALGHHQRVEEIKQMGPPSMEWERVTDGTDTDPSTRTAPVQAADVVAPNGSGTVDSHEGSMGEAQDAIDRVEAVDDRVELGSAPSDSGAAVEVATASEDRAGSEEDVPEDDGEVT